MEYLDSASLARFQRTAGPELAAELIERCLAFDTEEFSSLVARGEMAQVEMIVHRMTSDAGWLGARALRELSEQLEMLASQRQTQDVQQLLPRFLEVYRATARCLEAR